MIEKASLNFTEIIKDLFLEHNKLRTDPASYIPHLEQYINYFKNTINETDSNSDCNKILAKPGEIPIQTEEGKVAFLEAIKFLKNKQAIIPLLLDDNLVKACNDHVNDIGPKGIISYDSSNGKNVSERIEQYCEWDVACGENLDFGTMNAIGILINLLVNDGVKNRTHRKNLFNEKFNFIGIAVGEHKEFGVVAVIDYVGGIRGLGTPFYDYTNFKYAFPKNNEEKIKKSKTAFQLEDNDAPDETLSVKIVKSGKLFNGRFHKITKNIYTLEDGSTHIVEVEDV